MCNHPNKTHAVSIERRPYGPDGIETVKVCAECATWYGGQGHMGIVKIEKIKEAGK